MKDCIKEAYDYYHHPLREEYEREFRTLPVLFGRAKKKAQLREKYAQKGLKIKEYGDIKFSCGPGGVKDCGTFMGNGRYICELDGSVIGDFSRSNNFKCEQCFSHGIDCKKLQDFLWSDLLG